MDVTKHAAFFPHNRKMSHASKSNKYTSGNIIIWDQFELEEIKLAGWCQ